MKLEKIKNKKKTHSYLFMFSRALLLFIEKHQILSQQLRMQNTLTKYSQKDVCTHVCAQTHICNPTEQTENKGSCEIHKFTCIDCLYISELVCNPDN